MDEKVVLELGGDERRNCIAGVHRRAEQDEAVQRLVRQHEHVGRGEMLLARHLAANNQRRHDEHDHAVRYHISCRIFGLNALVELSLDRAAWR